MNSQATKSFLLAKSFILFIWNQVNIKRNTKVTLEALYFSTHKIMFLKIEGYFTDDFSFGKEDIYV